MNLQCWRSSKYLCTMRTTAKSYVTEQVPYLTLSIHLLHGLPLGLFPSSSPLNTSLLSCHRSFPPVYSSTSTVFSLLHLRYLPSPASTLYPHFSHCLLCLLLRFFSIPSSVWLGIVTLVASIGSTLHIHMPVWATW